MNSDSEASETANNHSASQLRAEFAAAFDRPTDPLRDYSTAFENVPDPFEYFMKAVVENRDQIGCSGTIEDYRRTFRQWREFMATTDRHPACPSVDHIKSYIKWRREVHDNVPSTIKIKFGRLRQAYEHWQRESVFPHPHDYNPFLIAREEASFGKNSNKPFPELSLGDIQEIFSQIDDVRSRALIGLQLKLGLRAGEVANLQLQDIHLTHSSLQNCYPKMGSHPALGEYEDVLYISPNREGNKSRVPRLLPIDNDLRLLLIQHLLTRPQIGEPWIILTKRSFGQLNHTAINRPWKAAFGPEYGEAANIRAITSHFGRHWFSSYCRLEVGFKREHVQYMRGDRIEPINEFADAIDEYLHPNYDQIEADYRNEIFKLEFRNKGI